LGIGAKVFAALKDLFGAGAETLAVFELIWDRAGKVLADRPVGVRAELEPSVVIELVYGSHERDVSIADQSEQITGRSDVPFGD
jgi:hypothetical protein